MKVWVTYRHPQLRIARGQLTPPVVTPTSAGGFGCVTVDPLWVVRLSRGQNSDDPQPAGVSSTASEQWLGISEQEFIHLWSWFTGIAHACLYTTVCGRNVTGSNAGRRSVAGGVDGVEYTLLRVLHHYVPHPT